MKHRLLAFAVMMALVILTVGTGARGAAMGPVKNPDTFVTLRFGSPESLDPAYQYDNVSYEVVWPNVYETLITYAGSVTANFVPRLATEVPSLANGLISADGLTYTFPIRQGVHFHDGTVMTPDDVRYSTLRFMLQDRDGGPAWLLLSPLVGKDATKEKDQFVVTYQDAANAVTVQGNNVVFHLKKPFAPFLSIIAAWTFVIPRAWAAAHGDWDGSPGTWKKFNNPKLQDRFAFDHMNGTGPFKLQEWDRQAKQVILVRNDGYWRKPAQLARVVIRTVEEFATRRLQLQQGDADLIEVNRPEQKQVEGLPGVTIRDGLPDLYISAVHFNQQINPEANPDIGSGKLDGSGIPPDFFSDVHIRRAFSYAFDYKTYLRDAWRGKGIQPNGPMVQGLLGYIPSPPAPQYTYSREKAISEFKEAWGGKVWDVGFKFTTQYNTGNAARQIGAQIIKDQVEALNPKFKIDVRNLAWPSFLQWVQPPSKKGTMFQLAWGADYPDPQDFAQPFLASAGNFPINIGYKNPEADRLVAEAGTTADPAKRTAIYRKLTDIAYNDAPYIFQVQRQQFKVMRSWVHGWYWNAIYGGEDYYPLSKQ